MHAYRYTHMSIVVPIYELYTFIYPFIRFFFSFVKLRERKRERDEQLRLAPVTLAQAPNVCVCVCVRNVEYLRVMEP